MKRTKVKLTSARNTVESVKAVFSSIMLCFLFASGVVFFLRFLVVLACKIYFF